ncbi:MAG: porin [Nitratireductor sp.]
MKLKSLLLGSAAVLVAVSGARAADAIVVEPEPVEYVRVCDAYGAGWFYIPGTETCLKFDGDVRVQYGFTGYHNDIQDQTSQHEWNYRARLNVRAKNETEYGTLASRIRFVAASTEGGHNDVLSNTEGPGSAATVVDWAVISLAGFRIGFADSYWTTAGGYGYYNARFDGPYNFRNGLFFDYTYVSNGFTATVGVEDGAVSGESGAPDVYAGITYSGSGWYMAGIYYHDSSASAGAWKVRADYDFGSNGFAVGGWYMADDGKTDYVKGHAWGVTAKMNLSDNMVLFGGYGQYADQYFNSALNVAPNKVATVDGSFVNYTVGISWNIVPRLLIQPEYTKVRATQNTANTATFDRFSLRIVRSF